MSELEKDVIILKEFINDYKIAEEVVDENFIKALEYILSKFSNLDKTNNDLRLLYRRTAEKLQENGREELAGYFLAQIDEVPTFVVDDDIDYYKEYYKQKERIIELEDENHIQRSQLMSAFDRGFIPKQKIEEILDKAEVMDYYTLPDVIADLEKIMKLGDK